MTVIKRNRENSSKDLVQAVEQFTVLLKDQDEDEAIADLASAANAIGRSEPGSDEHRSAVNTIVEAFEGDHELSAYILAKPNADEWTTTEQLSSAATRVLNLARRLRA